MEGILLVLFLLFSVVTALLERRKRRQQLDEAKERQQQQPERVETAPAVLEEEEDDEEWGGWPFPSGDPFEQPQAKPVTRRADATEAMPPATTDAQILLAEIERQARGAEQRAQAQEAEARARQRQARQVRPARSVAKLIGQRRGTRSTSDAKPHRLAGGRYQLTPEKARIGVIYAELLGPCKAEREEEWRW
jgi:hypothetical protein